MQPTLYTFVFLLLNIVGVLSALDNPQITVHFYLLDAILLKKGSERSVATKF